MKIMTKTLKNAKGLNYIKKKLNKKHQSLVLNILVERGYYRKEENKNLYTGEITLEEADNLAEEISKMKVLF